MANPRAIVDLTHEVRRLATGKIGDINDINRETTFLALNALIEAALAGKGFAVVANHVKHVSKRIGEITDILNKELAGSLTRLTELGDSMIDRMHAHDGQRCADLVLNMIDIVDHNLYERSCDVRWWATDSAVVDCVTYDSEEMSRHASERLSVILDSYTVYKDLWVVDAQGTVITSGRGETYPVIGQQVGGAKWFEAALATGSGADYVAFDVGGPAAVEACAGGDLCHRDPRGRRGERAGARGVGDLLRLGAAGRGGGQGREAERGGVGEDALPDRGFVVSGDREFGWGRGDAGDVPAEDPWRGDGVLSRGGWRHGVVRGDAGV